MGMVIELEGFQLTDLFRYLITLNWTQSREQVLDATGFVSHRCLILLLMYFAYPLF